MTTAVRVETNHECLGNIAPVLGNVDEAVAYIRLIFGDLLPEQFIKIIEQVNPAAVSAVTQLMKVCFGAGA
jgi:hypothetical protein